ncbi:ankyrin repeat domain-containing protein [Geitlerinema splendidum]|nr:ankyrin repeat domain-containing protein [Geitlerinema splendidum]
MEGANPNAITESGKSPLMLAAMYGHKSAIAALLDAGADPNLGSDQEFEEGTTALMYIASSFFASKVVAAQKGNLAIVERLIQAGADVTLGWRTGCTPIAEAAYQGYLDVVERLLAVGADPFQRIYDDEFYDALDYARLGQAEGHHSGKDHAAIIELLSRQPR